jgi:tetratricopeptide (TPR) repeat protein
MPALEPGRRICDRFILLGKLGSGGFAEVWGARDTRTTAEVAVKILPPVLARSEHAWELLRREHTVASRLDHPGVLRTFEPLRCEEAALLPMELAPNGDARRLRGQPYTRVVPVLIEITSALAHAHERGVVHGDLKPGNVLFDAQGRVKLADFGAAALESPAAAEASRSRGSPFSASPQQLRGEPPRPADDIYGLGALAYELLSGYPPHYPNFDSRRDAQSPPPLNTVQPVPPRLSQLVTRMLAFRPEDRPDSALEVLEALQASLNDTLGLEELVESLESRSTSAVEPEMTARHSSSDVDVLAVSDVISTRRESPAPAAAGDEWAELRADVRAAPATPSLMRIEPERRRVWPWLITAALAALAVVVFFWLPRVATPPPTAAPAEPTPAAPAATQPTPAAAEQQRAAALEVLRERRDAVLARAEALDARAASVWGGAELASARVALGEAGAALDTGDESRAAERLGVVERDLRVVESRAPTTLASQLEAGDRALAAGQTGVARQAFEMAQKIDPINRRAASGLERSARLDRVLELVAQGENALTSGDAAGAAALFDRAARLDPANELARSGLARARGAAGEDAYARALGQGFAALVAGRYEDARAAFSRAKSMRPSATEADEGLAQVASASQGRTLEGGRKRAADLEAAERWSEALAEYERILSEDASVEFARAGRDRVAPRAELGERLQRLIDRPERLAAPEVRAEANRLLARARVVEPSGPVIRSQIARLELLLPEFDEPVRLTVESDNATQISIPRVGVFGAFYRREIQLRPGRYTVVGTRAGYRDVRRDITIAPGQSLQTVNISCFEPI